jgi:hypothetical protein
MYKRIVQKNVGADQQQGVRCSVIVHVGVTVRRLPAKHSLLVANVAGLIHVNTGLPIKAQV